MSNIKFEQVSAIKDDLSEWEQNFLKSINNQLNRYGKSFDELSEKQRAVIDRLWDKHCSKLPPDTELPESFRPDNHGKFILDSPI